MPLSILLQVGGPPKVANGQAAANLSAGNQSDMMVSEYHGKYYSAAYNNGAGGNVFHGGMSALTSISNATFTVSTLTASATPIVGLWNPISSGKNAEILQASLSTILTALTATGGGPYVWATSTGNGVITTGTKPVNALTLAQSGSSMFDMSGVALTGLSNNLIVRKGSALAGGSAYNASEVATAAGFHTQHQASVENIEGSIIVPPGGVLALLATTTPVAHSAVSGLMWQEVPV